MISLVLSGKSADVSKVIALQQELRPERTRQVLARNLWPVIKDDHKDAIKDYQRDQLSCNDARTEAVQKSSFELDASVTKGTEIRQKQHAEFVVSRRDGFDQARCQRVEWWTSRQLRPLTQRTPIPLPTLVL